MMITSVINIRNAPAGWRINPQFTFIGRPSYLANPFIIGRHGSRDQVIEQYRCHLEKLRFDDPELFDKYLAICVRGCTLVCFCKPLACHGDVLVEMVDGTE